MSVAPLEGVQHRLARHYLNKLRTAEAMVRQGRASVTYGFTLFDSEWDQIRQWQAWAAQPDATAEQQQFAADFPLAGVSILTIRQSPFERLNWLEAALRTRDPAVQDERTLALLYYISVTYRKLGRHDEAEAAARQLIELATKAAHALYLGRGLFALGYVREEQGAILEAQTHYERSADLLRQVQAYADVVEVLRRLAFTVRLLQSPQQALPMHRENLAIAETLGQPHLLCRALEGMAGILANIADYTGDFQEATAYAERSAALCRTLGYKELLCNVLFILAKIYSEQSMYEQATAYLNEALRIAEDIGMVAGVIFANSVFSFIAIQMKNYALALERAYAAINLARQLGQKRRVHYALELTVWIYVLTDDVPHARQMLLELIDITRQLKTRHHFLCAISDGVICGEKMGLDDPAALWAGAVIDHKGEISEPMLNPALERLEAKLGTERFEAALNRGREMPLDDLLDQIEQAVRQYAAEAPSNGSA